jgi:hypothetical protein
VTRGDLNETELLGVVVEAVRFCIKGDCMWTDQLTNSDIELRGPTNELDRKR